MRPVEIKGSWAWLGGEDITAYRDELTRDEYIVDEAAGRVLSYVSAAELPNARPEPPAYEGEPSREEVFTALDTWLAGQAEGFDLGTMRPVSTRRVDGHEARGDTLEYTIRYQRYVEGVAVNEWVTGIASVPSWTWKPTYRAWKHRAKGDVPVVPTISFGEALRIASGKTPPSGIASAELKSWGRGLEWMVITKSGDAGMTTALNIDATTGEVLSKAVSSSAGFVSTAD